MRILLLQFLQSGIVDIVNKTHGGGVVKDPDYAPLRDKGVAMLASV